MNRYPPGAWVPIKSEREIAYRDGLLRAAEIAEGMAKQYVDQYPRPERDPAIYEQGIGMEKVQQAIPKEAEGE